MNSIKALNHLPQNSNRIIATTYFIFIGYVIVNYLIINPIIYAISDGYYYGAVADGLFHSHKLLDYTTEPPSPAITPQNGIVFIHYLLSCIGIYDIEARIRTLQIVNAFLFILSSLLIYKTIHIILQNVSTPRLFALLFLSSGLLLKMFLLGTNEGCYVFFSLYAVYIIIKDRYSLVNVILLTIISLTICHFRLQGSLILISASINFLFEKKIRKAFSFLFLGFVSIGSVAILTKFLCSDPSKINSNIDSFFYFHQHLQLNSMKIFSYALPGLFLGIGTYINDFGKVISPLWYAIIGWTVVSLFFYVRKRCYSHSFLVVLILMNVLFVLVSASVSYRFLLILFPFLIFTLFESIPLLKKHCDLLLILYIGFNILVTSARLLFIDPNYKQNAVAGNYIKSNYDLTHTEIISQNPRFTYFYFGKGSINLMKLHDENSNILIFGDESFIASTIAECRSSLTVDIMKTFPDLNFVRGGTHEKLKYHIIFAKVSPLSKG